MLRLRTLHVFMLLFIASFALAFLAREQNPSFQKCEAEYEAASGQQQKPKDLTFFVERIFAAQCTASFVNKYNAVVTAIATVLLTFLTGGLVWTGYLQIHTARAQLRAYVFAESAALADGTTLSPPQPQHANEPGVVVAWKNTGQTPAFNVVSWGAVDVIEPINEQTLVPPKLERKFASSLGAGGQATKALWFGRSLSTSEIEDIGKGVKAIYIYGRIEYFDIFGKPRFTNYRLAYSGKFPPVGNVVFNTCSGGNDSDTYRHRGTKSS
jgi:hypothetical protein